MQTLLLFTSITAVAAVRFRSAKGLDSSETSEQLLDQQHQQLGLGLAVELGWYLIYSGVTGLFAGLMAAAGEETRVPGARPADPTGQSCPTNPAESSRRMGDVRHGFSVPTLMTSTVPTSRKEDLRPGRPHHLRRMVPGHEGVDA